MANNDASRQASNIEDLVNSGVDIIIARALDSAAIGASIHEAKEAKIPFVTFDRASSGEKPTAHVGGGSADLAKVLGDAFEKILEAHSCKRRSNNPSLKRPDFPVAPEQKSGSRYPFALGSAEGGG